MLEETKLLIYKRIVDIMVKHPEIFHITGMLNQSKLDEFAVEYTIETRIGLSYIFNMMIYQTTGFYFSMEVDDYKNKLIISVLTCYKTPFPDANDYEKWQEMLETEKLI